MSRRGAQTSAAATSGIQESSTIAAAVRLPVPKIVRTAKNTRAPKYKYARTAITAKSRGGPVHAAAITGTCDADQAIATQASSGA